MQLFLLDMEVLYFEARWIIYTRCLEKIMLIANASFNFLFYALFGSDLRNHMKKCLFMMICIKKRARRFARWSSRTSSRISNLSSKTNRNRSNLSIRKDEKILYDIDENEENDLSQDDDRPPFTKVWKSYCEFEFVTDLFCIMLFYPFIF